MIFNCEKLMVQIC